MKTLIRPDVSPREAEVLARVFRAAGVALVRDTQGVTTLTLTHSFSPCSENRDQARLGGTGKAFQCRSNGASRVSQIRGRELFAQMRRRLAAV